MNLVLLFTGVSVALLKVRQRQPVCLSPDSLEGLLTSSQSECMLVRLTANMTEYHIIDMFESLLCLS